MSAAPRYDATSSCFMLINGFSRGTPSHNSQSRSDSLSASSRYSCSLMRLTMAMMSISVWSTGVARAIVLSVSRLSATNLWSWPSLLVFPRPQPVDGLVGGVMTGGAHDAAARPGAGAAEEEAGDRSLV